METQRSVLITGGSRGIGLGLARRYLERGSRVLVTGRDRLALERARATVPGLETLVNDLAVPTLREQLVHHVREVMPNLDLVVHNAGVQRRVGLAQDRSPWAERQEEIDILFAAPVHLDHLLVPLLLAQPHPTRIVTVSSGGAFVPQAFAPVYSASKAALHSYTTNLRQALRGTTVQVTEVIPPAVATGLGDPGSPHGADVEDFCAAAFAGIVAGRDVVGYGPTAAPEFVARLEREAAAYRAGVDRFPVHGYEQPAVQR